MVVSQVTFTVAHAQFIMQHPTSILEIMQHTMFPKQRQDPENARFVQGEQGIFKVIQTHGPVAIR